MAGAVKRRRRPRWKAPVGTRRQKKALRRYFDQRWGDNVFHGRDLFKWLKETGRPLPVGGELMIGVDDAEGR